MSDYNVINVEKRAQELRKIVYKKESNEFYIADFWGSEMTKDTPITERYFRIREYIKSRDHGDYANEWLHATTEQIWSDRFIGLAEDGFQKLEFQNPSYAAACRLNKDPRDYNNTFVIQINGCDYECSFCFIDHDLNKPELGKGKYFSVKEMIEVFLKARNDALEKGIKLNVIRLSGGEAMSLAPELIISVCNEIEQMGLSKEIYIWADCNLSTDLYLRQFKKELRKVANKNNFGIVGCIKTPGDILSGSEDFAKITKADREYFRKQFDVLNFLVNDIQADTYVYLIPIIWQPKEQWGKRLFECAQELEKINHNLPLRTNVLKIRNYKPVEMNMREANSEGRPLPHFDSIDYQEWFEKIFTDMQKTITQIWYNETLPRLYTSQEIDKYKQSYRCEIPLT